MSAEDGSWREASQQSRKSDRQDSWKEQGDLAASGRTASVICGFGTDTGVESLADVTSLIEGPLGELRRQIDEAAPLGIGLRLSVRALEAVSDPAKREAFRRTLGEAGIVAVSANGFAPGPLAPGPIKDRIFAPDWRDEERLHYTTALGELMAEIGPVGHPVSVTTVPGSQRGLGGNEATLADIADGMLRAAAHFAEIERRTGRRVMLALQPVPGGLLETAGEVADFFARWLFSPVAARRFAALADLSPARAADALPAHIGVCLDTAALAVTGEALEHALSALRKNGVSVAKLIVGAAIRFDPSDPAARAAVAKLDLARYLHPVIGHDPDGEPVRHDDLEAALDTAETARPGSEWRVYRRVAVSGDPDLNGSLVTPLSEVAEAALMLHRIQPIAPEIEVESLHPWDHPNYQSALKADMAWVRARLGRAV